MKDKFNKQLIGIDNNFWKFRLSIPYRFKLIIWKRFDKYFNHQLLGLLWERIGGHFNDQWKESFQLEKYIDKKQV